MTRPYLVIWAPTDAAAQAEQAAAGVQLEALGWRRQADGGGACLWTRAPEPAVRLADSGWLIGRYLGPESAGPRTDGPLEPAVQAAARARRGWGEYVAIWPGAGGAPPEVLRDPSGALEAYSWRRGRLCVLASGVEQAPLALRPERATPDWDAVAAMIARPFGSAHLSGLAGVTAVAPGTLLPLGAAPSAARTIWRPADFLTRPRQADPDWAARLGDAVRTAVAGLAAAPGPLLTEASGGLDSSIVLACLAEGGFGDRVAGVLHYHGDRAESDERRWARRVVEHFGLALTEVARPSLALDPARDFDGLLDGARPPLAALDSWRDADVAARADTLGATAVMTGMGGDASLFNIPGPQVLADLLHDRGAAALADPLGPAVARWLRRPLAALWVQALRPGGTLGPASLLAGRARDALAPAHPWVAASGNAPPAKAVQIASLAGLQLIRGRDRRSMRMARWHPLLAQPVLEAAIAIPTWGLVAGGRDRGLARRAFAGGLPPETVARRGKGGLTSVYSRQLAAGGAAVARFLCDGALAEAGLLDREAVAAALAPEALIRRVDGLALVRIAAVEAWARRWS